MPSSGWPVIAALIGCATRGHFAPVFQNQTAFSTAICGSLDFLVFVISSFFTQPLTMDVPEPEQSPFTAVTTQTSKLTRVRSIACHYEGTPEAAWPCPFLVRRSSIPFNWILTIAAAISSLFGCLYSAHHLSLGRHQRLALDFLPAHRPRGRMVHWYAQPACN